jgi:hypothetical protein
MRSSIRICCLLFALLITVSMALGQTVVRGQQFPSQNYPDTAKWLKLQVVSHVKPVSPRDFAIMAWGLSPSDPQQLAGMKEAGLNKAGAAG